ncbi:MAG: FHA domain-containing protein [Anaerolineae bacterium]
MPSGMTICPNCGNLLIDESTYDARPFNGDISPSTTPFPPPTPPQLDQTEIAMTILGTGETVVLSLAQPVTLGRRLANTSLLEVFDLTSSGGIALGVSRRHAQVFFDEHGVLCIRDVGSTNGTYINGERLEGDQIMRLISGMVVMLGRFSIHLYYV